MRSREDGRAGCEDEPLLKKEATTAYFQAVDPKLESMRNFAINGLDGDPYSMRRGNFKNFIYRKIEQLTMAQNQIPGATARRYIK
ncbi:hypothetical protein GcC1_083029 [Golovinomyces cichoracearum]|uniref:Uncharacterized protein n=1 Tax=Golovinomyces cichoracearum TaxID=62708 RepID=A0A420IJM3_9PEZI|nr:hypothetical protein GcC1_083029 [Golovinomyces cichoracearum]